MHMMSLNVTFDVLKRFKVWKVNALGKWEEPRAITLVFCDGGEFERQWNVICTYFINGIDIIKPKDSLI